PAALAVPAARRRRGIAALFGGAALFLLVAVGANLAVRGSWSSYGGERQGFYSYTGFPGVELPADTLRGEGKDRNATWLRPQTLAVGFDVQQSAWNLLYFLVGRHVGVLVYFLPLLLALAAFREGEGRWAILVAVALSLGAFFYLKSFNFWGGGDALANRYFLPLYPALWFVTARSRPASWPVAAFALAAPFLLPLWSDPWGFPRTEQSGYRHVSTVAQRWLPYETTQSHLKPSGGEDVSLNGLWIKSLGPEVKALAGGRGLHLSGKGTILVGSPHPLEKVDLEFSAPGPARLEVEGARLGEVVLRPGGTLFQLRLAKPRARHRMWWTDDDVYLYQLTLELPKDDPAMAGGADFQLRPR
ncbi:MAG: hypothetical protein KDD47_26450, partial [Acidobacteria bacterium]|nr:hypothetical protein [Acidobacteriota bacterium]